MKPDQERVKNLLCDTVTLLCKNGLTFGEELRVEGLIGITLDSSEVFLVNINERFSASSDRQNETLPSLDLPGLLSSHSDEKMTVKNQGKLGRTSNQNSNTHKRNDSVMEPSKVNDSQSLSVQQSSNVLASGKAAVKLEADDDVVIVEGTGTQIAKEENNSSNMKGKDNLQIQHPQQNSDTYGSVDFSSLEDEHEFSDSLLGADHPKQGEPPSKRRTLENINPVASESQYVPGLVKNEQATEAEISSNQWQNISATPVSSMPGCSDWSVDTSKDTTMQQGDSMANSVEESTMPANRDPEPLNLCIPATVLDKASGPNIHDDEPKDMRMMTIKSEQESSFEDFASDDEAMEDNEIALQVHIPSSVAVPTNLTHQSVIKQVPTVKTFASEQTRITYYSPVVQVTNPVECARKELENKMKQPNKFQAGVISEASSAGSTVSEDASMNYKGKVKGQDKIKPFSKGETSTTDAEPDNSGIKRRHICKFCGNVYKRVSSLSRHKHECKAVTAVKDQKPFQCTVCKKNYLRSDYLIDHMRGIHGIGSMFVCPDCGETFKWRFLFTSHRKSCPRNSGSDSANIGETPAANTIASTGLGTSSLKLPISKVPTELTPQPQHLSSSTTSSPQNTVVAGSTGARTAPHVPVHVATVSMQNTSISSPVMVTTVHANHNTIPVLSSGTGSTQLLVPLQNVRPTTLFKTAASPVSSRPNATSVGNHLARSKPSKPMTAPPGIASQTCIVKVPHSKE